MREDHCEGPTWVCPWGRRSPRRLAFALAALVVASTLVASAVAGDGEKGIVLAARAPDGVRGVARTDARRILTGLLTEWPDGSAVQLVLLPKGSPEMKWLCARILKMPEEVYRRLLLSRVFRGLMSSPVQAQDAEEAKKVLEKTPGGIAPLRRAMLGDKLRRLRLEASKDSP